MYSFQALVEKELFYQSMFTCCLEIVIFSYGSSKKFPWILDALDIEPIHFVKVIELIVRSKDQLSREMIKHLNKVWSRYFFFMRFLRRIALAMISVKPIFFFQIEESVLESLIWKSSSQIWDIIAISGQATPKFEDTALPGHLLYNEQNSNRRVQNSETSPSKYPELQF